MVFDSILGRCTQKTATFIADGGGSLINFINPNQEKAGSPIHIAHPPND